MVTPMTQTPKAHAAGSQQPQAAPAWPPTPRRDVVETIHGIEVHDPYRWLEQAQSPEVVAWTKAQDRLAREQLARLPGREALQRRLTQLSRVESMTLPLRRGSREFFARQHADKEKPVYYVHDLASGATRVLLDPNTMSADGSTSVQTISYSYDGRVAAYRSSRNNSDETVLHLMAVDTGQVSELDTIPGVRYSDPSFTPNGDAFYYTRLPTDPGLKPAERSARAAIYRHRVGTRYQDDELVFANKGDPGALLGADLSRDGRFLFVYVVHGWNSTDVYVRDFRNEQKLRPLVVGVPARFYFSAFKGSIFVRTNYGAERWRLLRCDHPKAMGRGAHPLDGFREIVPEDREAVLDGYAVVGGQLCLHYERRASTLIKLAALDGTNVRNIELPGLGSAEGLSGNPDDDTAFFSFESFLQPPTIYKTSVSRGGRETYFTMQVPADATPYPVDQVAFASKDGTQLSMFVITNERRNRDGSTPFLLLGYGGFNVSVVPRFDSAYFAWLEAGGGLAIANLRGGGEHGEAWHKAGMLTHKQNVFDDFIAAAEYLIAQGYTSAAKLAIRGGSNGGLLVGAAMTQRPELFAAVVCRVPLLDMVRYALFGSARGWTPELGSPEDPEQFRALYAYSPYHRVRDGVRYPALLVMSADSDDRVDPMHARKFVAAVQHATASGKPVWLRVEVRAGHAGADMVASKIAAEADEYAFMLAQLGAGADRQPSEPAR